MPGQERAMATNTAGQTGTAQVISTGSAEIDKKLGGGIPVGSLVLLEGQSESGKSVVSNKCWSVCGAV